MDDTQAAQGNDQPAQDANPAGQADQEFKSGIQKRIDELTARYHRSEDEKTRYQEQVLQMTQQMAEMAVSMQRPQTPTPAVPEFSEEQRPLLQHFESRIQSLQKQHQAELAQLHASVQQSQASQYAGQYATKLGVTEGASWIQERAGAIAAGFRQKYGTSLTPDDAAKYATMEWLENQAKSPQAGRDNFGRFMPKGSGITNAPNPTQNLAPQSRQALPTNFEDLSPRQQEQMLASRGVDDLPL